MYDWLIVGAGFAGSVLAERLASQRDESVLLIDRRSHVGGNAYDHVNGDGLLVHKYGPHIFHTNSDQVLEYLSAFTAWRPYEHRVLAAVVGKLLPIPINLNTIEQLYGLRLTPDELEAFFRRRAEPVAEVVTSEDVVVSRIGRELYRLFFQGYTRKQWGLDPSQLDRSVTARVPVRCNRDDRYFTDKHQYMPLDGYTALFQRMLAHPNIEIRCGVDYRGVVREGRNWRRLIYSGRIDDLFERRFGVLPYRSLSFTHETLDVPQRQPVAVVNYPQDEPYTRVTEYKHLTGQRHRRTSITTEYPAACGDPYYPIPRPENRILYRRYADLAERMEDVFFVGRLATYQYYNMDQVVGQALATFRRIQGSERCGAGRALLAAE